MLPVALSLILTPCGSLLSVSWITSNKYNMAKVMRCHSQDYIIGRLETVTFHLACQITLSGALAQREASCHVVPCPAEKFMWQGTDVSAKTRGFHSQVSELVGEPWEVQAPSSTPTTTSERPWGRGLVPEFLILRNWERINVCCFKPVSFGLPCYASIVN